jgi:hypothetical protein
MGIDSWQVQVSAVWVVAILGLGYLLGTTSAIGWGLVAAIAAALPVLVRRFWRRPEASMSESIRDAMR